MGRTKTTILALVLAAPACLAGIDVAARQILPAPELLEPVDGGMEGFAPGHITPLLVWATVPDVSDYRLQIATDSSGFEDVWIDEIVVDDSLWTDVCRSSPDRVCRYFWEFDPLSGQTSWNLEWRVKAIGTADSSAWSDVWHFTVTLVVGREKDLPAGTFTLSSYPEPSSGNRVVSVTSPVASSARLRIVDLLGRELARLFDGVLPQGTTALQWNAESLPPGTYFVMLSTAREQKVHVVTVR
jgi:hypothetical protein